MRLTNKNYYYQKADWEYFSVSQYKNFFGTYERKGCEAQAMAILKGEYTKEPSAAMLVGSYVDSWIEGTLNNFTKNHPEVFNSRTGELKAEYKGAEKIIERIKSDKKFMQYLSGEKQVIMTAELFGVMWKIKMDSYLKTKAIVDFKTTDDIYKPIYCPGIGKLNFIAAKGQDFQLAIYQKVVELNTCKKLPCYIAAADRGKVTNIELIQVTQPELDSALIGVRHGVERIKLLKSGEVEPERCRSCDYCKETKVITSPILMSALLS